MADTILTFEELQEKVLSYSPEADVALLRKAYFFTREAHCDQKRMEGTPYVGHPLSVASILADMHMDDKAIIAGLLHDTVEDTETTLDDIKALFGKDVAFLVSSLTKLTLMELKSRKEVQEENFRKMFLAMAEDVRVIVIKFADRLHNMKTLQFLPPHKQKKIAQETLDIYAPLANRLGMGWLKAEFEDLGFKYVHPEKYEEILRKVAEKREDKENYLREVAQRVIEKLKEQAIAGRVNGRVKNNYGIYQKMMQRRVTFEEVYDVLGLRIITDTKAHCYAVLGLIHSMWLPVPGRFKDYVAMPKSNMYQSLHTTVIGKGNEQMEFQIRTEDMHLIAEKGIASHWLYKEKGRQLAEKDAKYIEWLRNLVSAQKDSKDAREFLEMFQGEVAPDAVFVFTPAGEIKELPNGSTPVDFAYSIHTEVGNRCVGAKINGRIVPLKYKLQNGDAVEIITSQAHGPSRDWLGFVVTQKAKNRIKHWVESEQKKQGIELGTTMMEEECRRQSVKLSKLKSKEMLAIVKEFKFKTLEDLHMGIGYGKVSARQVINRLKAEEKGEPEQAVPTEDVLIATKTHKKPRTSSGVTITGMDNLLYVTAKCCYPVPGDEIIGYITKGKGVTVHRSSCRNLQRLSVDEERMVQVSWSSQGDSVSQAKLFVETVDKPGILANLSFVISSFNLNLSHFEAHASQNKHAHFTFTLDVKDRAQLDVLYNKLVSSEGVIRVSR